jgi:hypothetical protein
MDRKKVKESFGLMMEGYSLENSRMAVGKKV